jgi:hypothetical protein
VTALETKGNCRASCPGPNRAMHVYTRKPVRRNFMLVGVGVQFKFPNVSPGRRRCLIPPRSSTFQGRSSASNFNLDHYNGDLIGNFKSLTLNISCNQTFQVSRDPSRPRHICFKLQNGVSAR